MSYPILTLPPGLTFKYTKTPKFNNIVQRPQSGRHPAAATLQQGTIFEFDLNFDYLKQARQPAIGNPINDVQTLQEFYEATGGGFAWFEFNPAAYNLENLTVTKDYTQIKNGFFGQGDGITTVFPLWRSTNALGGGNVSFLERIQNVTALGGVYENNGASPISGALYALTNWPATVTFVTAPAGGVNLSWGGSYDYLCQFAEDSIDEEEFMFQLWKLNSLKMETINL